MNIKRDEKQAHQWLIWPSRPSFAWFSKVLVHVLPCIATRMLWVKLDLMYAKHVVSHWSDFLKQKQNLKVKFHIGEGLSYSAPASISTILLLTFSNKGWCEEKKFLKRVSVRDIFIKELMGPSLQSPLNNNQKKKKKRQSLLSAKRLWVQ